MHSAWFKRTKDKEAREAREKEVRGASWAFHLLEDVLEKEFRKKENVREYEDPQWVHKQIAVNEYNQALDDLLSLIQLDKR